MGTHGFTRVSNVLVALSLSALIIGACTTQPSGVGAPQTAQPVTLNFGSASPATTLEVGQSSEHFRQLIEKASGGRITVRIHHAGSLITHPEMLDAFKAGTIDVGALSTSRHTAAFPMWNELATLVDFDLTQRATTESQIELTYQLNEQIPEMKKEFSDNGIFLCVVIPNAGNVIMAKKPIKSLADLQGFKMRTFGTSMPAAMTAAGAVPVSVGYAEMYTATSAGTVDGAMTAYDAFEAVKYDEVAKYITQIGPRGDTPIVSIGLTFAFRQATYDKLSAEDKKIIDTACKETETWLLGKVNARSDEAREQMLSRGAEMVQFDEASLREWRSRLPDFLSMAAENLNKLGKPGTKYVELIRQSFK